MPTQKKEKRRRSAPEYLNDYETNDHKDSAKRARSSDELDYNSDGSTTSASSNSSSESALSDMINFVTTPAVTSNININQESEAVLNARFKAVTLEQARLRRDAIQEHRQKRSFYDDIARTNDLANDIDSSDNETDSGYNTDRSSSSTDSASSGPSLLMNRMNFNDAAPASPTVQSHLATPRSILRPNPANALANLESERRRVINAQPEPEYSPTLNLQKVYEEEEKAEFNATLEALQDSLDILAARDEEGIDRDTSINSDRWEFDRSNNFSVSGDSFDEQESGSEKDGSTGDSWLDFLDADLDIEDFGKGL